MELGLLYEIEAAKPWPGEHPWGQRTVERQAYREGIEQIKLGFGVALMPYEFVHPARVAEAVATVDLLSGGRAVWGMGRSTPMEQTAFGVDIPRSKEKLCAAAR